jgi:hypothetical protein
VRVERFAGAVVVPLLFVAVTVGAGTGNDRSGRADAVGTSLNCRDGREAPPRLRIFLNLWGLRAYPGDGEEWPEEEKVRRLGAAGFDGFDVWVGGATDDDIERWESLARAHDLEVGVEFGPVRVEDAEAALAAAQRLGAVYLDAHVASYFTPTDEAEALLRGLVERCRRADVPLVIQTHRGRVTQDLLRTIRYARAIPDLRFDLDVSHYFVAGEITGPPGPEAEAALSELMDRAIMLDGRISNGEQVQVDLTSAAHREATERTAGLWKGVMVGWLKTARQGDVFPFRVELGPPAYAIVDAEGHELSDRFEQQIRMRDLVEGLWNEAVAEAGRGQPHRPPR